MSEDEYWMSQAIEVAQLGDRLNEVPVGCVIVKDGQLLASGHNQPISAQDATAHAEIVAIRQACKAVQNYRLVDCTLYVTIEPCAMCAGAIVHSRFKRVVFGAPEPKAGMVESNARLLDQGCLNHVVDYRGGVLAEQCSQLISAFFARRRAEKKAAKQQKTNPN